MESLGNIRKWVIKPSLPDLAQSLQPAMQGDAASQQQVCGALLWTAFAAPGAVTEVYDAIAAGAVGDPRNAFGNSFCSAKLLISTEALPKNDVSDFSRGSGGSKCTP